MRKYLAISLISLLSVVSLPQIFAKLPGMRAPLPAKVKEDFEARKKTLHDPSALDSVMSVPMSPDTRNALMFLYAYMQDHDITSRSFSYFLKNVEATLAARDELPWGETVPEREFRHFVLPLRVNNEDLDMSRPVFYEELRDRVKGVSMEEAIQAVNHWCHEKVTYRPSDMRTSSPLSCVSQAIGRCGEESTFTVAALRSVGIPARQVYTPRWAHTDDNHAWVEAWADGKWHFIGACEPEPVLDLAWFNAPAGRGLLMVLNVFGPYDGLEEVVYRDEAATRINVTSNYAPVAPLDVKVLSKEGNPVKDAEVRFAIYNYSEFNPVATTWTDADGSAHITAGLGDMVVWASDGTNFGFKVARPEAGKVHEIVLDKNAGFTGSMPIDIVPPQTPGKIPFVTAEQRKENNAALAREDSIRNAYEKTFLNSQTAEEFLKTLDAPEFDTPTMVQNLVLSRGNHEVLTQFLSETPANFREEAAMLITALPEKDLRDVPLEVLRDHLKGAVNPAGIEDPEVFAYYILSPRVYYEGLTPWRSFFSGILTKAQKEEFRTNPESLRSFVIENIRLNTAPNNQKLFSSPEAVWEGRIGNVMSRNIFFVAAARACGLPARIDPITLKTQILPEGSAEWVDVVLDEEASENRSEVAPKGELVMTFEPADYIKDPKYFSHFAISRIDNGMPNVLDYDGESFASLLSKPLPLDCGQYVMVTGRRMADGSVLSNLEFFNITEGEQTRLPFTLRNDDSSPSVIGSLNAENLYRNIADGSERSLLSSTGRGYYALGIIRPNHEPTAHALNELSTLAAEFNETGRPLVLLFESDDDARRFNASAHGKLPENLFVGVDLEGVSAADIRSSLNLPENVDLPLFVVADTFNRIVYVSNGYSIGTAERLINTLRQVEKSADK